MTATTDAPIDLSQYVDQRVILHYKSDDGELSVPGVLLASAPIGVMFKPRGRTQGEIIEAENIMGIEYAPAKAKKLKAKKLKDIAYGQARQHLADRHATPLALLATIDEQQALTLHEGIDHSDLGHMHESEFDAAQAAAGPVEPDTEGDDDDENEEQSEHEFVDGV